MAKDRRQGRPSSSGTTKTIPVPAPPTNHDQMTPKFCLAHIHGIQNVNCLSRAQKADFASALQKRSRMLWADLRRADKHGLGLETLPIDALRISLPAQFADQLKVLVFRYSDLLPMVGIRVNEVFHILAIEDQFGALYDHGK
jgi:hypothetical protein